MNLSNVHLSMSYEYLTDCIIVLFHADGMEPKPIHATGSIQDAFAFCSAAFPFLNIQADTVEVRL